MVVISSVECCLYLLRHHKSRLTKTNIQRNDCIYQAESADLNAVIYSALNVVLTDEPHQ